MERPDWDLVVDGPPKIFLGALPALYADVPGDVVVNLCGVPVADASSRRASHVWELLDTQSHEHLPSRDLVDAFVDLVAPDVDLHDSYWHCHAGINRSSFVLCAYLHRRRGLRISEAIRTLRERRTPLVLCNATFERRLRQWYGGPDEQDFEPFPYERWKAAVDAHQRR